MTALDKFKTQRQGQVLIGLAKVYNNNDHQLGVISGTPDYFISHCFEIQTIVIFLIGQWTKQKVSQIIRITDTDV